MFFRSASSSGPSSVRRGWRGVDFSKYYRDPGEVSERDDRSWIGLMKSTALLAGQTFTLLLLVAALSAPLLRWLALSISPPLANFLSRCDLPSGGAPEA